MGKSLTLHNYNKSHREHNVRAENCVKYMTHLNKDNTKYNIVLKDEKIKDAYDRIFGEAVKEYNERQQNPQRKIHNYYEHVKKSNKNLAYELVLAIGDKDSTGSNYNDTELERECLIEYFNTFQARNPHLECIGYYIHYDEATVHAHCCYLPVASGYKNGPKLQAGLNKALGLQGFKKLGKFTAQIQWQNSEREAFKQICVNKGIDIIDIASDKHKHMEKEQFIQYNTIKKNEMIINGLKEELETSKKVLKDLQGEILRAADVKEMTLGTNILGQPNKNVKLSYKDYIDLKETAAFVEDIIDIKDNEIIQEQERNKELKKENIKLYNEKSTAELGVYKAIKNIEMLERSLDDYAIKFEALEEELNKEKAYNKSLEMFMNNVSIGGHSVLDMYINENETKLNRQQRRARERKHDDYYDYDYDDMRYY